MARKKKKAKEAKTEKKETSKKSSELKFNSQRDLALDFAAKAYKKFDKLVKAVVLFGSSAKNTATVGSDLDIVIIIDDATVRFDEKLVVWYREELEKLIAESRYDINLHINTVKLSTWWTDLMIGDPTLINIIRYGDVLIDFGGFFTPLKILLQEGKIKNTPEAIYTALNRVPFHIGRSKQAEMSAIEGCYWAMVDSAQSMLMTLKISPPSPEHIPNMMADHLVKKGLIKKKYVNEFLGLQDLHKKIMHGQVKDIHGKVIDYWQDLSEEFFNVSLKVVKEVA